MKDQHEVYIHTEGSLAAQPTFISADQSISQVLQTGNPKERVVNDGSAMIILEEDDDIEVPQDKKLRDFGNKLPKRIHCHRCRKIGVTFHYNGENHHDFPPSFRITKLIDWAKNKFGIDRKENFVLRLESSTGEVLNPDSHLGSYVNFPNCSIKLFLTPLCQIQG